MFSDKFSQLLTRSEASEKTNSQENKPSNTEQDTAASIAVEEAHASETDLPIY